MDVKVTPINNDDDIARQKKFESGEGFKAEELVTESGIYDVCHDSNIKHNQNGLVIVETLYKGDSFPSCSFCKPIYCLSKSKSNIDF